MKKLIFLIVLSLLLSSCSGNKYLIYEPSPTDEIFTFYSNGMPIGSYTADSSFILFSADEIDLFGKPYLRVWLLYENTSNSIYTLEPYNLISIEAERKGKLFSKYTAESPTKILSAIEEREAMEQILITIGGALEAISTEGTTVEGYSGTVYKIHDEKEKRDAIIQRTGYDLLNTANWYNIFKNSFSSGVLRKNTVFPNQSVNGYIYFPLNKVNGSNIYNDGSRVDINEINFKLLIKNENDIKRVELVTTTIW